MSDYRTDPYACRLEMAREARADAQPEPLPCSTCGAAPDVERNPYGGYGVHIACLDCYDGAPDAGPQNAVYEDTEAEAVAAWNELQVGRVKTITLLDGDWEAVCAALQDRLHTLRDIGGSGAAMERVRATNALIVVSRQLSRVNKGREAA